MENDDYMLIETGKDYSKIVQTDGVRTTVCANRYEIATVAHAEINEQQAIQQLREWIRWRRDKELRESGDLPS